MRVRHSAPLLLALLLSGCRTLPRTGPASMEPGDVGWEAALLESSRRVEPYDGMDRQADLRATLITPRLRRAFLVERARFHGRFAEQAQRELLGMGSADEGVDRTPLARPPGEDQILVFVAFYAADLKHRDLASHTTIWDTHLVRGTTRVAPLAIEPVRLSPAVRELFSYVDRFDDVYLLRFPLVDPASATALLAPGADPLTLEVNSAVAEASVSWSLFPAH